MARASARRSLSIARAERRAPHKWRCRRNSGAAITRTGTLRCSGFARIADPRVVCVIVVCNPQSRKIYYGGYVCGPVFKAVVRESLIRMECPEDPMPPGTYEVVKDAEDADVLVAQAAPAVPGAGSDNPLADIGETAELAQAGVDQPIGEGQLPRLIGLTKRQVKDKLAALEIEWDAQGSGWVVAQPVAGDTSFGCAAVQACVLERAQLSDACACARGECEDLRAAYKVLFSMTSSDLLVNRMRGA